MTSFNVKITTKSNFKVQTTSGGIQVPAQFSDLSDFDTSSGLYDKYLIMYDAATQKYIPVNPDEVLSATVTDTRSPGLPTDFKDQLDTDLDNRIDLDGGTF
jgi:hypothetical protein